MPGKYRSVTGPSRHEQLRRGASAAAAHDDARKLLDALIERPSRRRYGRDPSLTKSANFVRDAIVLRLAIEPESHRILTEQGGSQRRYAAEELLVVTEPGE